MTQPLHLKKTFWDESSHLFKRNKNLCSQKNLQINFHSSFIRSNQTTPNNSPKPFNRWMFKNKQTKQKRLWFIHTMKWSSATKGINHWYMQRLGWISMALSWVKKERLYIAWFIYTTFLEVKRQNPRMSEQVIGDYLGCVCGY